MSIYMLIQHNLTINEVDYGRVSMAHPQHSEVSHFLPCGAMEHRFEVVPGYAAHVVTRHGPMLIQVMDDHFCIQTHGDLGHLHFRKPPYR